MCNASEDYMITAMCDPSHRIQLRLPCSLKLGYEAGYEKSATLQFNKVHALLALIVAALLTVNDI